MATKIITEAEAKAIFATDDADDYPYRVINHKGRDAIVNWVNANAKNPGSHNLAEWQSEAEQRDAGIDEDVCIEMPGRMTATGNPVVLSFDRNHFDWQINA